MYKAVIFDLDGTLLDTLEDLAYACNYALEKCGFKTHEVNEYKRYLGQGRYKLIEKSLEEKDRTPNNIQTVMDIYNEYYTEHIKDFTKPYDGIVELLEELKAKGLKLCVISNKPDKFTQDIVKDFFGNLIDVVYGQREGVPAKPDPAAVLEVIDIIGLRKDDVIFVGDSEVDIRTGKNAKMDVAGVTWGFRDRQELELEHPDYIVLDAGELKKIIITA
jgi:phosphoglycolate phosphatase